MRLINTKSLRIEAFAPSELPRYAILSHTWANEEVSFQDFNDLNGARTKRGFMKIEKACELAREKNLGHVWVDTCCIDKTSSAELSESINSMYKWYRQAEICFAYLSDWPSGVDWAELAAVGSCDEDSNVTGVDAERADEGDGYSSDDEYEDIETSDQRSTDLLTQKIVDSTNPALEGGKDFSSKVDSDEEFSEQSGSSAVTPTSRQCLLGWFTRGWTLQELIAPSEVEFYDANWVMKGMKSDPKVVEQLSRITQIPPSVLSDGSDFTLQGVCLGQRMSWAAHRKTSREEDIAYCLLGIFQVNMPMLYGEGANAFLRLQEEIMKYSEDLSLFAWTAEPENQNEQVYRGILSRHPREFRHLQHCCLQDTQFMRTEQFAMTNKGLRFENFTLFHIDTASLDVEFIDLNFMDLGCLIDGKPQGIILQRMYDTYVRIMSEGLIQMSNNMRGGESHTFFVARDVGKRAEHRYRIEIAFGVKIQLKSHLDSHVLKIADVWPSKAFDRRENTFLASDAEKFVGIVTIVTCDQTCPIDESRPLVEFVLILFFDLGGFLPLLADAAFGTKLKNFTRTMQSMDQVTAKEKLQNYLITSLNKQDSELSIADHATITRFRVIAKRRTKELSIDEHVIHRKAVKVELRSDTISESYMP